jgi:hypothetical protein
VVDGDADMAVAVHHVDNGHGVDAPLGMHRAHHAGTMFGAFAER